MSQFHDQQWFLYLKYKFDLDASLWISSEYDFLSSGWILEKLGNFFFIFCHYSTQTYAS